MAKVAILVPYLDMCDIARTVVSDYANISPVCVEYIQTELVVQRARELEYQGCDLIVARGLQAKLIRQAVRLPLVEIHVTAQELGGILLELKYELQHSRPRLALIGYENMFGDMTQFNHLFGIDLHCYWATGNQERMLTEKVEEAIRDGCEAVVGGDVVCRTAKQKGLPCRFIPSGVESIRTALKMADTTSYAIDLEKHNSAEMDTMLNHTFTGIMQTTFDGTILRVNRAGQQILEMSEQQLTGKNLNKVFPQIDRKFVENAIQQERDFHALVLRVQSKTVLVNIAPLLVDEQPVGCIVTFQEGTRVSEMDSELRRELYQRGFIAKYTFDNTPFSGKQDEEMLEMAHRIAKFPTSVLLTGENGTGKDILAQCIHNDSLWKNNAFIPLDCSAWLPETLDNMLFGNFTTRKDSEACMVELARDGTLYLSQVDCLPLETQYKVLQLIRGKFLHNGSNRPISMNVRVIASTSTNLMNLVVDGEFRVDLYYALNTLSIELPPLRRNRESILPWFEYYLNSWQQKYKRFIHLTNGAKKFLEEYDWPGNLNQMDCLCERTLLLTQKRNVDEVFLRTQVEQIASITLQNPGKTVLYKDKKAVEIAEALQKHNGSREKAAEALGISKTTLWRYIKKYGISLDYSL